MVYLDYAATTPIDPRVLEAMMPYLKEDFGNPSSIYVLGQRARSAIDKSRATIAGILGVQPKEVIFTSGGTESNNLFLLGVAEVAPANYRHIIATKIEHDSVLKPLERLREKGFEITLLEVDADGIVDPAELARALRPDTLMVSIMYANNEIGTVQPVRECADVIKEFREKNGASAYPLFHTDACQAAAYLSLNLKEIGVDALTLNAGKIYGPKGVGVLFVRGGAHGPVKLMPQIFGGGQEYRMRSGTENVAGIVGLARALELVVETRDAECARLTVLRDKLIDGILKSIPTARLNGSPQKRLPNNVNVSFKGLHGEAILIKLDMAQVAASSGSACSSGSLEPSHVIKSLGAENAEEIWSRSATRFSLGHQTTADDIDMILALLPRIIEELNQASPF